MSPNSALEKAKRRPRPKDLADRVSRLQLREAEPIAAKYGDGVEFQGIGDEYPNVGTPTQIAIFSQRKFSQRKFSQRKFSQRKFSQRETSQKKSAKKGMTIAEIARDKIKEEISQ